jgi:hypothetical protein
MFLFANIIPLMSFKKIFFALAISVGLAISVQANPIFPSANIGFSGSGMDDPFPGFGRNYCSLGDGIRTVLWNPASISKIPVSETYFSYSTSAKPSNYLKAFDITDPSIEASGTNFKIDFLLTGDRTETEGKKRTFDGMAIYSPQAPNTDFKQGFRLTDWFVFGVSSNTENTINVDLDGNMPAQYYANMDLLGTSNFMGTGITIESNGHMTYQGITTADPVNPHFLSQTQRIPVIVDASFSNNLNLEQGMTLSGATVWNGISAGLSFTPMTANLNVNNTARGFVDDDAADPYVYQPNFDPNNPADVAAWMADSSKYGTDDGYRKRNIRVPAGESVGEAMYCGFFRAETARTDLGVMADIGFVTLGAKMENIGGAAFNFKGTGQVAYVNYREAAVTTQELGALIDPSQTGDINLFKDTFTPWADAAGIGMPSSFTIAIPQRTKIGATLNIPLKTTVDYEMQNNPIEFTYRDSDNQQVAGKLSNIKILRAGIEIPFYAFAFRTNVAALAKPDVTGLDPTAQKSFDDAFKMGVLPLSTDFGLATNIADYGIETALGFDASNVFSAVQLDTQNLNLNRFLYSTIAIKKDNWHLAFSDMLDLPSTAAAVENDPNRPKEGESDPTKYLKYLKWTSTITFGFRF